MLIPNHFGLLKKSQLYEVENIFVSCFGMWTWNAKKTFRTRIQPENLMLLLQTSSVSQEWDNINDCVLE